MYYCYVCFFDEIDRQSAITITKCLFANPTIIVLIGMPYVFCSDDEEEDFSQGINTYLKSVSHRRHIRSKHTGPFTLQHIGPENRIVAACTFDKKYM